MPENHDHAERPPRTALEEVRREAEDAELSGEKHDDEGEAADAITPDKRAGGVRGRLSPPCAPAPGRTS